MSSSTRAQHIEVSAGHVDQGQRRPRHRPGGISLLMEWWTIHHRGALQSLARDARRSHRSVEGDDLSNVCVLQTHRGEGPPPPPHII